ncbi:glycosyltransferase family 25 protein [Acinetobacter sp. YH16031]|uniref:glycosyltransferase family 25 protein n=1 Tax=Acinetobacter sp. YH16031 TaxID=2601180 RepID=UPI0015D3C5DE|nr:glycosyltransferase family 25 protein [Acinetobacter sp. YH16031]
MKLGIYLINLDSSTERLAQATTELKKHNIEFERIPAVDGRKLHVQSYEGYDSQKANALMGRDLLGAEIGCYLSHKRCVSEFLASDYDYVIVVEDDLEIISDLMVTVEKTIQWLEQNQKGWYLMNIGSTKRKLSKKMHQIEQHQLLKAYYFPVLTLGLVWSREGAQAFQNNLVQINAPIDVALQSWLTDLSKGYSIYPPLVQPNGAESDIDAIKAHPTAPRQRVGKRWPRQKRMWGNKLKALKNKICSA